MNRFCTFLVLSLVAAGCGTSADADPLRQQATNTPEDGGVGGAENLPFGDAGGSLAPDSGRGGSDVIGVGGAEQGDAGPDVNQGGTGGSSEGSDAGQADAGSGQGGTEQGGAGGSDVGEGGSDQGGEGGSDVVEPECNGQFARCNGDVYEECDLGVYMTYQCSPEVGLNCYPGEGCVGDCLDGATRCAGETAETCVHGEWTASEECPFQCVGGACEGSCAPGAVVCDGLSLVTCGSDFTYGSPVACPTDPNGTTSCSAGVCDLQPIACGANTADCDGNWSCETDLTSVATCGSCDTACPAVDNAAPTCTVSGCGFTCDAGFEDCDGDPSNGCELDTRTDTLNCGACGNSCYGTACEAGQCEFAFEVVSDYSGENTKVLSMTLTGSYLYWLTATEVRRAPKDGGPYETLATVSGLSSVVDRTTIVVAAGKIAWTTQTGVYVMPETGGTPTRIFVTSGPTDVITNLVTADDKLYWNDSRVEHRENCAQQFPGIENSFYLCNGGHATTFHTYDLTTGALSSWQRSGEYSTPLGVVDSEMYVARYEGFFDTTTRYRIVINVYDVVTGAFLRQIGGSLRVDGANHYGRSDLHGATMAPGALVYATYLTGPTVGDGMILAPLAGGDPLVTNQLISTEVSREFVADATTVYYIKTTGIDDLTSVRAVALTGELLAPIFQGETNDFLQLALDDAYIYFTAYTNDGEQAILRAPK